MVKIPTNKTETIDKFQFLNTFVAKYFIMYLKNEAKNGNILNGKIKLKYFKTDTRGSFVMILLVNLSLRNENLSPYKK